MGEVELRHLRALVAVVAEGTFTDAAIALHVGQPAVSRTIDALERIVGARLVERTTRSVALTPAGVRVHLAAVTALAAADDVVAAARGDVRPLRLGYAWSALGWHTSAVLRGWRAAHPDVPLEVHRIDDLAAALTRASVDVAVIRGDVAAIRGDVGAIRTRSVFREPRLAAVPVAHDLAARASVRLADLTGATMLLTGSGTTTPELWPATDRPRSTLRVDNIDEWITEIAGGLAIGVTTGSTAAQHAHPGIAFVPIDDAPPVPVHLAWPAARMHPSTAAFVDLVEHTVAAALASPG